MHVYAQAGGFPVLVGASRKSFIGHVLGDKDASGARRLWGTAATSVIAVEQVCVHACAGCASD
jgi:dihydropteroate synthase